MFAKTIVITGPESTGKTTLAAQLSTHFQAQWLPEYARGYINGLDKPYSENDLLKIAKGQVAAENAALNKTNELLFLDTSSEVIKIWSEYKYGRCHPWILKQIATRKHGLYLLCRPDITWQFDPQRENPYNRDKIFDRYLEELKNQNTNFVEINGLNYTRLNNAILHVESYIHIS